MNATPSNPSDHSHRSHEPRPRVLIVDDDADLLDSMRRHLRSQFDVTVASSFKEAIQLVTSQGPFAVVVSDLRMPATDGATLLFCVRMAAPATVGILLTGHPDLESAMTVVNLGNAFRYLTKPCSPGVLVRALEDSVERHRITPASPSQTEASQEGTPATPNPEVE